MTYCLSAAEHNSELEPVFDRVLSAVKEDQHYSEVWALRQARCPIIRFIYEPHQLHCDLSVNNRYMYVVYTHMTVYMYHLCRLGPANTRLLAAYMNFDSRMAVLVPCVRLWARGWGIKRRQLNNYSLSLMLIHSLQHTSPPVLPCLQVSPIFPNPSMANYGVSYRIQEAGPRIWHGLAARDSQFQLSSMCTWMAGTALSLILVLS